jgi:hypothetical protein
MKKITCRDLRGACDEVITGETADEMSENCKQHVMSMIVAGDEDHKKAINEMMALSQEDQQKWHNNFKTSFDSLENA